MAKERPINAEAPEKPAPTRQPPKDRRRMPLALKLIAGAVGLAAIFLVAAILGGGSGSPGVDSAAPTLNAGDGEVSAAETATNEIGYPAFATKNTTRIGGPDASANAAGAALAVYPGTSAAQRPAAVTFVDAGDWAGGIAAASLMAAPVGAPILVSEGERLPNVSSEAFTALDPRGSPATGGSRAFAIGDAAQPRGGGVTAVRGGDPAETAASVAAVRERLLGKPRHVVVAPLEQPAFAMPAAAWAARSGDPVLFASRDELPQATAAVLKRNPRVPVYVLGPSAAVSSAVVRAIGKISKTVRRVSGEDPVANAIALARYADGDFGWNVNDPGHGFVIARDDDPLDAAAAAPLSAAGTWGPLLLTDDAATLPAALRDYLLDVKPGYTDDPTRAFYNHVWVIGDQEAIDVGQQAEIDNLAELEKIGGGE